MSKVSDCQCNPHDAAYYGGHKPTCPLAEKPCGVKSEPDLRCSECGGTGCGSPTLESPEGFPCKSCYPIPAPESRLLKVKQQYVIGFLFNYTAETVLLIQKNRPDWQKGKLNGVGGHVEHGEKPVDAMKREFYEEAGLQLEWDFFCTMVFPECEVHCFRHIDKSGHIIEVEQKTDEFVDWYNYNQVPYNVIPNLHWLIPMALQKEEYMTEVITDAKTSALVRAECQEEELAFLNKIMSMPFFEFCLLVKERRQALKASVEGK